MTVKQLVFNGINGATGEYLLPPLTPAAISQLAQGFGLDDEQEQELAGRHFGAQPSFAVKEGVDPKDLAQTGWGVVFAHDADPALKDALGELLTHRAEQAGDRFRVFEGIDAYRPGESKDDFLVRNGAGPGPANPDRVPYYLLLVGDPEAIPYRVQYQLDVQYAVGRLHFETPEEYARYARSVVTAETGGTTSPRRAVFFGVRNDGDLATAMSHDQLVKPLAEQIKTAFGKGSTKWQVETVLAEAATKQRLATLLGGAETPSLLFTASHGMGFPVTDPHHPAHQGALLCQDWLGPEIQESIGQDAYFAADDLTAQARLLGLITFHFACFGAGTPRLDDFAHLAYGKRTAIARHGFVAPLPRALLGHPKGGALATIGHVERAWSFSFAWGAAGSQTQAFQDTLHRLLDGHPVGSALEPLNARYAELSSDLNTTLEDVKYGKKADDLKIAGLWTANNDARAYAVVGDPAVRLTPAAAGKKAERPTIGDVSLPAAKKAPGGGRATRRAKEEATDTAETATPVPAMAPGVVAYGFPWIGGDDSVFKQAQERVVELVKGLAEDLSTALTAAMTDLSRLDVATYVADDVAKAAADPDDLAKSARLRAFTRMALDGDTVACVPENADQVDAALWAIHTDMVTRAQAGRADMLKTATSAVGGLLGIVKGF
ncbi:MAG TPA: hypothetical protein VH482_30070 [Thermomicrobiales bacterium]|jgi:hypothetical protein